MYDTLEMFLKQEEVKGKKLLDTIPPLLENISTHQFNNGYSISGYYGSLKVSISKSGLKIKESSLCKYWLKNNFETLCRGDVEEAINSISDGLKVPLDNANVTRVDVAHNLRVTYEENIYYPYLGDAQYYQRRPNPNGLYYDTSRKTMLFYGKVIEQKQKGNPVPELYQKGYWLRYELRLKSRVLQTLKIPEFRASLLYDHSFYERLCQMWKKEYLKINKLRIQLKKMRPTGSTKKLIEQAATMMFLQGGYDNAMALIKEWQAKGEITKKQASDHRKKIRQLFKEPQKQDGNDLIKELDKKVILASRFSH